MSKNHFHSILKNLKDLKPHKFYGCFAALNGAISIALGALAAHYLIGKMPYESLQNFKMASKYHLVHAVLILILSFFYSKARYIWSLRLLTIGIVLFSGSIYMLSTKVIASQALLSLIGPLTPIGGICLICGWLSIAVYIFKQG